MRRAAAICSALAALALGGCSVDVEGAPCPAPGSAQDCPSGQACGNDRKCSERAAACAAPEARCTFGDTRCTGAGGTEILETCTAADPVCGAWERRSCAAGGLLCGTRSQGGVAACECPALPPATATFAADPALGSGTTRAPFATGAQTPPECRFESLGDAIARAGQVAGAASVQAYGAAGAQVVFEHDPAIVVPATVAVFGAAAPAGPTVVRPDAAPGEALLTVQGTLDGVRVERGAGDAAAVATTCGASGKPALANVVVDGGGVLATGIDVSGTCGADLTGVEVSDVAGPALRVHADAAAPVAVQGGSFHGSQVGAEISGGSVTFGASGQAALAVEISFNAKEGILLGSGAAVDGRFHLARVHGNGGTGVVVEMMTPGSSLAFEGCDVYGNGATAARSYGSGAGRPAGGLLVATPTLPLGFAANRTYANTGDQLAFETSSAWSIAPGACGASSNLFACTTAGAYAVSVGGGGSVDARNSVWPGVPIGPFLGSGVTGTPYCNGLPEVPPTPACTPP